MSPEHFLSWGNFLTVLITLVIGGGSGGFFVAYQKDRRQAHIDKATTEKADLDLTQQLRQMAKEAVAESVEEMKRQDQRHNKEILELTTKYEDQVEGLTARVELLEKIIREANLPIPPKHEIVR